MGKVVDSRNSHIPIEVWEQGIKNTKFPIPLLNEKREKIGDVISMEIVDGK